MTDISLTLEQIMILIMFGVIIIFFCIGVAEMITEKEYSTGRKVDCMDKNGLKIIGVKCEEIIYCGVISNLILEDCKSKNLVEVEE